MSHVLQALGMAQEDSDFPEHLPIYICFNPYFPEKEDRAAEKRRLEEKLERGGSLVRGIYLQVRGLACISRKPVEAGTRLEHHMYNGPFGSSVDLQADFVRVPDKVALEILHSSPSNPAISNFGNLMWSAQAGVIIAAHCLQQS